MRKHLQTAAAQRAAIPVSRQRQRRSSTWMFPRTMTDYVDQSGSALVQHLYRQYIFFKNVIRKKYNNERITCAIQLVLHMCATESFKNYRVYDKLHLEAVI